MAIEVRREVATDQEPTLSPPTTALLLAEQKLAQAEAALLRAEQKLAKIKMVASDALSEYYIDMAEIRRGPMQTHVANGRVVRPDVDLDNIARAADPLEQILGITSD